MYNEAADEGRGSAQGGHEYYDTSFNFTAGVVPSGYSPSKSFAIYATALNLLQQRIN